jgi:hypothetical protein
MTLFCRSIIRLEKGLPRADTLLSWFEFNTSRWEGKRCDSPLLLRFPSYSAFAAFHRLRRRRCSWASATSPEGASRAKPGVFHRTVPQSLGDRVPLVLAGNPYWLDPATLMDLGSVGLAAPDATVDAVKSCRSECFVIPRGDLPFSMRNPYRPDTPLFSAPFLEAFGSSYQYAAGSRHFDLWECRRDRAPDGA